MNDANRNVAALLTPAGVGAIAVIRVQGPAVPSFLRSCFSRPAVEGRCVHGELRDGDKIIDDPVIVLSADGLSADINLHGGSWVVQSCLALATRHQFAVADSSRLPLVRFMLDGTSEVQNEILAYLPLAKTELALTVLLAQSLAWERLARDPLSASDAARLLADRSLDWLLHPPRIAIVGVPNAGKSTLANQLFGRQRSITADQPGTTRDWVGETANIDGLAVTLVDTPGLRVSEDPIETQAIERAEEQIKLGDAIVLVLDAERSADPLQQALLSRFPDAIRVVNKIDSGGDAAFAGEAFRTIATTGAGIDAVRIAIRRKFQCEMIDSETPRCWTDRQRNLLQAACATADSR